MQATEHSADEVAGPQVGSTDIAIVGMACRFPGAADYDEYWQNLISGKNCIREVPPDRWDWRQYFGDPRLEPNKTTVKWGGFIDDIDKFDPLFFGISPSEAAFIDPQHRIFLEAAWHAVEDAGYSVASLSGRAIGVYAGVSKNDYSESMRESGREIVPYISTGTVHSILVNRVSFLFNLHGRSEAVDTACSSSMVALHNAIRDIVSGECQAALVGGVNALITPTMFISHTKSGMLSPDGQCRTFSSGANGYVRSEGVGVLFIKSLHQALADRDHIHAVIKSSAINHGGRSNFLTSPTTEAQAAVVMSALRRGKIDPRSIDYIEAHGTGTPLGDPIEIDGLKKAFAQLAQEFPNPDATREPHCTLGSAKTNVGHLESASGMAGIIKVIMAMKHRQIPAIRNFERLNPYIELEGSPFRIATANVAWERGEEPRRAGVSSFGMGGVNAHVVLEEAPETAAEAVVDGREHVIPLSAKKGGLKPYAQSLLNGLALKKSGGNSGRLSLRDVAYTLQAGRDVFDERLAVVATSVDDLLEKLEGYLTGAATPNVFVGDTGGNGSAVPESSQNAVDVAARWVRGAKVDWIELSEPPPRRVPLPTYPFDRKRCWFTDVPSRTSNAVHVALATVPPDDDRSVRTISSRDFFIRDHVVQGRPMLPAVVHLEFVRAAASAQMGDPRRARVLRDVYWMTPVVAGSEDVAVQIRLTSQDDRMQFELLRGDTVHSKGSVSAAPSDGAHHRKLDLQAIDARCYRGTTKGELYALLREHGLAYGSSFQAIERYAHNDREILAELRVPAEVTGELGNYALHPSLMDGVFQTVTALSLIGGHTAGKQFIPFYLESAEIVQPMGGHCFVHATIHADGSREGAVASFDATLTDGEGNVLVAIRNLQKRPIEKRQAVETAPAIMRNIYYRPVWRRRGLLRRAAQTPKMLLLFARDTEAVQSFRKFCGAATTIVLVRPGDVYRQEEENLYQLDPRDAVGYERLLQDIKTQGLTPMQVAYLWGLDVRPTNDPRDGLDSTIYGVLHFTRAAFKARIHGNVKLVYLHPLDGQSSLHSMVAGFARTLKYENPRFDYVTLGVDRTAIHDVARAACAELGAASEVSALREVRELGGERYERTMVHEAVANPSKGGDPAPVTRTGGVYLIAGGAGGLGSVFSRYLAETYQATLLWLGRAAKTSAIGRKIAEIEEAGGTCEYFSVDITDRDALAAVISEIKTAHPVIHGVIHAAAVIEDAFILRKGKDSFARVIAPKVAGAINLDVVTRDEALDFFLVFSSIAALMPNQGQCDYAAANSFLDSFMEVRNGLVVDRQRSGVSLALNWPLWENGGIRVTAEEERHLLRTFGMSPLPSADGLAIFETSLAFARQRFPAIHQLAAVAGNTEKIERCLGVDALANAIAEPEIAEALRGRLETEIKSIFAARLGITPHTIDGGRTIGELGVSSSMLVGVTQDLNQRFAADLKPTLLFDINTVDKLAAYLVEIGRSEVAVPRAEIVPVWNRSLIDVDQSDPARMTFSRTFKTAEFYLRDHVVDGQFNMPGACYIEMARQAGDLLLGNQSVKILAHNYWASPLSSPKEDFTASVQFTSKQDHLAYEIVSFTPAGERRLHAMGQISLDPSVARAETTIDMALVKSRCDEIRRPAAIYEQIVSEGLHVGPTFQPMTQIFLSDTEALAMLELPEAIWSTAGDYVLNPALLTGVFQTALISNRRRSGNPRRYVPIGMDELEVIAPIPAECYVYCQPRAANARNEEMRKFDLEVCRPDGVVVVRLKGFSIRALKETAASAEFRIAAAEVAPRVRSGDAPLHAVYALIKAKLAGPIGLTVEELDATVEFDQYGVTSVMVVELNQTFEDLFGPIPKTLFFEYRNIAELAEYFVEQHGATLARLLGDDAKRPPVFSAASVAVSDGEAERDGARIAEVCSYLRSLIARPIGLSADEIDFQTGFDQYGVNSVMVVELNEIFEAIFGPLSKTLFFEHRSIDELGHYFLETHRHKILAALPPRPPAKRSPESVALRPAEVRGSAKSVGLQTGAEPSGAGAGADVREDIAIVSAAGRFPGARNLREFWDVLRQGRDCITEIPPDRFDYRKHFNADPAQNGIYGKWGGFIDDVDRFDPAFFNISPREAELIDPQERLLLEVVWEMLEHAGYTRQRLLKTSDRRVGVFVGALWQPYESAGVEATLSGNVVAPSSLLYSIANRISYFFDLAGPSMAIDTACSSSLTALHLACQSIRGGESRSAIVAGVNLSLTVSKYLFLSRNRFLSTDGRCRSYGAGGDGYVPGEGICALLVKPLADAIAGGDSILAVIKGSAVNHGGRTNGYTVPSPRAQGNVIVQALEQARIDPRTISYIEGHGTGTSLGDPIEIDGLEKALGLPGDGKRVVAIGSVKSNIGHLEAAAGVASVIKVILQMQHGQLAPSLHTKTLNPNIDFGRGSFRVQRELAPWPRPEWAKDGKREEGTRIAGISSFGAGGSNAHLILEEYDGPPAPSVRNSSGTSAALCVFSAKTEDRLFEMIGRFEDYLRDSGNADLHGIAYTLQFGREGMRERLAVVAGSVAELRASLAAFLTNRQQAGSWRRGRASKGSTGTTSLIELRDTASTNLFEIAEAWVEGSDVDWTRFYGGSNHRFLPLPTYPFAKERYWLDAAGEPGLSGATLTGPAAVLHPLLHRNTSVLNEQRYSTTFTGDEFFLVDHRVKTDVGTVDKVLPGVAYVEMARAAIEQAMPARSESAVLELLNTVWTQPIIVSRVREVSLALAANGEGQIKYRIYSLDGQTEVVHCQGCAVWSQKAAPVTLDLEQLGNQMRHGRLEPSSVYGAFARMGLVLGPSFQPITAIDLGDHQLLAHVRLPKGIEATSADYVLHPTLMDGALQGSLGLIDGWFEGSNQLRLPFALGSLRIVSPCPAEMIAWMRYSAGSQPGDQVVKLDIDLCDERGRVCVQMMGFAARAREMPSEGRRRRIEEGRESVLSAREPEMPAGLLTLAPVWEVVKVETGEVCAAAGERVVVIGGEEEQHRGLRQEYGMAEVLPIDEGATIAEIAGKLRGERRIDQLIWLLPDAKERGGESAELIEEQEQGVLLGFRLIKALLQEGYGAGELRWTVITHQTMKVGGSPDETVDAAHSSVHGLVGSMAKEYRNWKVRLVDTESGAQPWSELLRLGWDERGEGWAWRERQWYRQRLVECELGERRKEQRFKRRGVYVVIGGAGGVGEVVTEYLIRTYDARLVWIGRRPQGEDISQKIERVTAAGSERPLYIAADARKPEELERARREIKERYQHIDGVIHSAIVLTDKSLANMPEEQFRAALSAKVDVAVCIAAVFGREPLDFILYFSSAQSFLKAPGQSNYAAGCTFTDAFAGWQSANAGYAVKVMNWGYWGTVGVVASADYQERMARLGWGSLGAEEGMAGVERLLAGPLDQIAMIRTIGHGATQALGVTSEEKVWAARDVAPSVCERLSELAEASEESAWELTTWETQRSGFDDVLVKMLRAEMRRMGWRGEEAWQAGRMAGYERWLKESLSILSWYGDLEESVTPDDHLWNEWDSQTSLWEVEGLGAQVRLADAMLHNLGEILRGGKRATDVMFPGSSLALVEGVYKNNAVSDHFNGAMANVVRRYVEERRAEGEPRETGLNLRLLELGAGTGGSSQGILQKLDCCREDVAEYCYSDVSKIFLVHGEEAYGAGREYLKYAVVDVERGLEEQGVERGAYDVVLAANVLHATRRLRETLRNAKAALKENGILVLNEISAKSVFMHLTFGLLAGWWAYEDEELRMEGSPGLTAEGWRRVLEEEGFRSVCFPAHDAARLGQQIIVAESDGVIRQKPAAATRPRSAAVVSAPAMAAILPPATETSRDSELLPKIEAWLVDAVGVLLKVRKEDVDLDAELSEFGFDSISLTGLANHVNRAWGLELMPTLFFEHPTARRFARYLVETHAQRLAEKLMPSLPSGAANARKVSSAAGPIVIPSTTERRDSELLARVEAWLIDAASVLLKVKKENIDPDAELSEFGFDSISLTGLANHVNNAHGLDLMPTIFFEHPTARTFARHLVEQHGERLAKTFGVESQAFEHGRSANAPRQAMPAHSVTTAGRLRVETAEAAGSAAEPIAIIGMSGRFPGAEDLETFWENLKAGKESVVEIPRERWDWRALDGDAQGDGNQSGVRWGAFMDGVAEFDPLFFGISPREAELMDPQHRLTMMYGWKAFEDAGYGPKQLWGSRTGVFVGTANTGYGEQLLSRDGTAIEGYTATGLVPSVGPNRLSYLLNLHGPSEPIETACSSSLVAVHRAVRAILSGDCTMALVGGVNTLFPTLHISFSKGGMLSRDGKCKTFSSRADGYVRGEGVGMVVLKRLSDAERDGDHIYGLIRGSAENHGGRAQSLTAPNPLAQAELIKDACRRAGVSPGSVSYIEAHGTGTSLGDPIEINGLKSAFQGLSEELGEATATAYCGLGSVKSNIGHLELAAGMAGLIKIVLQLKHGTLVRTLHCEEVNPYIRLEESPFYIVTENQPWKRLRDGEPRRAGVSSFGFGGVNAHVVVEEYVGHDGVKSEAHGPVMVVLSAKDAERLKEQARQLRQAIGRGEWRDGDLVRLAYTLQVGREAMEHRVGMIVASLEELDAKLEGFAAGTSGIEGLVIGEVKRDSEALAVFRGDDDLRDVVGKWLRGGKWVKLLDLWVKGLEIDWQQLYGEVTPQRLSLPTYPFAREHYWIDMTSGGRVASTVGGTAILHPLLHSNVSDLSEQRYSSTFTGEEFFLRDHRVSTDGRGAQRILPGVAYLEMARAAMEQASSREAGTGVLELHNTVWLKPIVVAGQKQVTIVLYANDGDKVGYEIHSMEDGHKSVHCQGEAVFGAQSAPRQLDLEDLERQMDRGRMEAADVYALFAAMGFVYGPSHQGILAVHLGDQQLLAQLHLPAIVETSQHEYVLHPSVMDSALQAAVCLFVDGDDVPNRPPVPFALESLRIVSACTREMTAWVRYSKDSSPGDSAVRLDIDLCGREGSVCIQMQGFASRALKNDLQAGHQTTSRILIRGTAVPLGDFDTAFYERLITDVANRAVSVDDAVELVQQLVISTS